MLNVTAGQWSVCQQQHIIRQQKWIWIACMYVTSTDKDIKWYRSKYFVISGPSKIDISYRRVRWHASNIDTRDYQFTASHRTILRVLRCELVQAINLAIQNELTCAIWSGTSEILNFQKCQIKTFFGKKNIMAE